MIKVKLFRRCTKMAENEKIENQKTYNEKITDLKIGLKICKYECKEYNRNIYGELELYNDINEGIADKNFKGEFSKLYNLMTEWKVRADDVSISGYPALFNGLRFKLRDIELDIAGELLISFVVQGTNDKKVLYMFRTRIEHPGIMDSSRYKEFTLEIKRAVKEAGLKMFIKAGFIEPVFYSMEKEFSADNTQKFLDKIDYFGKKFVIIPPENPLFW